MSATWPPFRALPAYLGGKRRLVRPLFGLLAEALPKDDWRGLTFIDPFLGGGSVSLFAKGRGFRVVCNDLAQRSAVVGRALIANSSTLLALPDIATLLCPPQTGYPTLAQERYSPGVFPKGHAKLLDRVLHNVRALDEPKRSLARLLTIKWALRIQPMSMLRGTDARAAADGDYDRVSSRRLGHYMHGKKLLTGQAWQELSQDVNVGVFPGQGEAFQEDALTFLRHARGDVVYLDPPYAGTTSYEREYAVLDDLLEGQRRSTSAYSRSTTALDELFVACVHVPVWLISFNNVAMTLTDLVDEVRRYRRNVHAIEVPYRHLASIASEAKNAENKEFLILATS